MSVVALDSNIMLYASGVVRNPEDVAKGKAAVAVLEALHECAEVDLMIVTQALGEVCSVLIRCGWPQIKAVDEVRRYIDDAQTVVPLRNDFDRALTLVGRNGFQIWDALIVAAAEGSGARFLLSEDMQDGFVFGRLTVFNPLTMTAEAVVARLSA